MKAWSKWSCSTLSFQVATCKNEGAPLFREINHINTVFLENVT
jgi:hypothetical protein